MPTYEYRCPQGHEFEKFQRMNDPAEAECPECGSASERMLSGGAGLLFKGEGFYITDYRSESYRKAAEKEKKDRTSDKSGKEKTKDAGSTTSGTGSSGSSDSGSGKGSSTGKGSGE